MECSNSIITYLLKDQMIVNVTNEERKFTSNWYSVDVSGQIIIQYGFLEDFVPIYKINSEFEASFNG